MKRAFLYAVALALLATGPAGAQSSTIDQRLYSFEDGIPRCIDSEATADTLFACTAVIIEACDAIEVNAGRLSPNIGLIPCAQEANTVWISMVLQEYALVEKRFNDARHSRFPELLDWLEYSQEAWDDYRIRQCGLVSQQRVFSINAEELGRLCELRLSIQRVLELRRLRGVSVP